jgi:hypothetical protein
MREARVHIGGPVNSRQVRTQKYFYRHAVHSESTVHPHDFHRRFSGTDRLTALGSHTTLSSVTIIRARSPRAHRRRSAIVASLLVAGCLAATTVDAEIAPLFRLFLLDGTIVTCLGEYARVGERVVFTLPLTTDGATELTSLAAARVDWTRTEKYAESLRAARYADARGESDFADLAGDVARILNEIAFTNDASHKLQLAVEARRRLDSWPREHYGYRTADIAQIVELVDQAISEFRVASGENRFDLTFVASPEPPKPMELLPAPSTEQLLQNAASIADSADNPAERLSLLETLSSTLDKNATALRAPVYTYLKAIVTARIRTERAVEASYSRLAVTASRSAERRALRGDVRGVEREIQHVQREDRRLGEKRPDRVSAILAILRERLDSARRLRLARDQWSVKVTAFRNYRRAIAAPLADLRGMAGGLDDIKRLAGPSASELPNLAKQATSATKALALVVPPTDLASAHMLIKTAAQLAMQAVTARGAAVTTGAMDQAWQASSAAAGALMLLARAKQDLDAALTPPGSR